MQNEALGISIGIIVRGITEVAKLDSSFAKLKVHIKETQGSLNGFTKNIAKIKKLEDLRVGVKLERKQLKSELLSATSMIARSAALAVPVKLAIDFEEAMADVKKVVDFDSNAELNNFGREITALARKIPLSASELATITASGGQLGIAKENLLDFTETAAKMGVAFDMSADQAGDSMGKLMNIFKTDIAGVTKLGDAINHLSDNSASKASEVVEVLKRIGGTARTIGLTSVQASALASSFISLGKTPELAATSADTLMKKLGNIGDATDDAKDALAEIGMDAEYVMAGMRIDPQKMIMEFLEATAKMPKDRQLSLLTKIFGVGFSGDIALLVGGLDTYKKSLSVVADKTSYLGSMQKEFENRSSTTANALQLLKNSVVEIGINFGSVFLPPLSWAVKALSKTVGVIIDLTRKIPGLNAVLGFGIASFLLLKPAMLGARLGANYLKDSVLALKIAKEVLIVKIKLVGRHIGLAFAPAKTALVWAYNTALNALKFTAHGINKALKFLLAGIRAVALAMKSNPLGLVLGAIAIAAGLVIYNWDKVKVWFISFLGWLRSVWEPIMQSIKQAWKSVSLFFGVIIDGWKLIFGSVAEFIGSVFEKPVNFIKGLFEPLFDWLGEKFGWVSSALDGLKSGVNTALGWVGLGNDEEKILKKDEKKSLIQSSFTPPSQTPALATAVAGGGNMPITIQFSGDFNIATSDGKFDLIEFERQVTNSVKRAMQKETFNRENRDIRG